MALTGFDKAIVGGLVSALGVLLTALQAGHLDEAACIGALLTGGIVAGGVYLKGNLPVDQAAKPSPTP